MPKKKERNRNVKLQCVDQLCPVLVRNLKYQTEHIRSDHWKTSIHKNCTQPEACQCQVCINFRTNRRREKQGQVNKLRDKTTLQCCQSNNDMTRIGVKFKAEVIIDYTKPIRSNNYIVRQHVMPDGKIKNCFYRMSMFSDYHPWVKGARQTQIQNLQLDLNTMSEHNEVPDDVPAWWFDANFRDFKKSWTLAYEQYLKVNQVNIEDIVFNELYLKKMFVFIGFQDERWENFPQDKFNIVKYAAHKALYDFVRNQVENSQVQAVNKRKKELAEKLELQKKADEATAQLEKENLELQGKQKAGRPKKDQNKSFDGSSNLSGNKRSAPKSQNKNLIHEQVQPQIVSQNQEGGLTQAWELWKLKKRETKQAMKAFRKLQGEVKFFKDPETSDSE